MPIVEIVSHNIGYELVDNPALNKIYVKDCINMLHFSFLKTITYSVIDTYSFHKDNL
jgi:hypothetical protein